MLFLRSTSYFINNVVEIELLFIYMYEIYHSIYSVFDYMILRGIQTEVIKLSILT